MKYRNVVIPLTIVAGKSSGSVTETTLPGLIKRCVIAKSSINNPGTVRAAVKDKAGDKIAELQHIDIYKIRDVEYKNDGVPLNINGGSPITFEVIATQNFGADFHCDLILIYEEQENC